MTARQKIFSVLPTTTPVQACGKFGATEYEATTTHGDSVWSTGMRKVSPGKKFIEPNFFGGVRREQRKKKSMVLVLETRSCLG